MRTVATAMMLALHLDRRVFSGFGALEVSLLSLVLGVISKSDASGSLCHIAGRADGSSALEG